MIKKYLLYLLRWQLSTPILAVVLIVLADFHPIIATVVANLIGGLIFFWVDKFIFKTMYKNPLWEIVDDIVCADCGKRGRGYRIVEWMHYSRTKDKSPQFRCEDCKDIKFQQVKTRIGKQRQGK